MVGYMINKEIGSKVYNVCWSHIYSAYIICFIIFNI
ncbi:hypothetical protein [Staphylococcus pseudoxylosus]